MIEYKTYTKHEYHSENGFFEKEVKDKFKRWDLIGLGHRIEDAESVLVLAVCNGYVIGEDWVLDDAAAQVWKVHSPKELSSCKVI